ncbi:Lipoprotein-anchoring transpeptidase ErfK/SrfK OS=Streptomyces microflavus OX=1919 GN=Smic_18920 PE=4 SV=1 [Streptomyces microflavus]
MNLLSVGCMNHTPRMRTVVSCTLLVVTLAAGATACGSPDGNPLSTKPYDAGDQVSFNGPTKNRKADPDKPLEVTVKGDDGRITDVSAVDTGGRHLAGELSADGRRWRSTAPLAAGTGYTVRVSTENGDGAPGTRTLSFDTSSPKKLLKVAFGPETGTYGVGQPITAELSAPVTDKASRATVERALKVRSTPAATGAWYWVDDNLHYRPQEYWPANATIEVRSNLTGIKVTNALYGAEAKPLKITTGDRVEALTDASTHTMTVLRNGEVINTIPVTTGKPGFSTRNGVKVILAKEQFVRMRGESIGIAAGSSESYDLPVLNRATRVTWSGEYVHAAPWSTGSQGNANVSHGCTGMSTGNAEWFFDTVRQGDIVKVVGSAGETMTPFDNGFGDWNLSWEKWQKGSALNEGVPDSPQTLQAARLRPHV